jgi:hypothetical protein
MTFARWALILPVVWGIRVAAQDASPPTQLEQALIEHVCNASRVAGAVESGAYQSCLTLKLTSIRADFGRDLSKLSVSDRKTIDTTCSKVLEAGDRDAYVDCLSGQLTMISARRARPDPAPSAAASSPVPAASSDAAAAPAESSSPSVIWIGIGIGIVVLAASAAFAIMQRRRAPGTTPAAASTCRNCGAPVSQPGGLCQTCRREAADAARKASAERSEIDQAPLEDLRQRRAQEDAARREQERVQQELEAREREEDAAQREAEARQREEEARRTSQTAEAPAEAAAFDPYLTLGVSRNATTEQIRNAYIYAMSKYDASNVEHLGAELQDHYRAKAQAVEQAFLMLTR